MPTPDPGFRSHMERRQAQKERSARERTLLAMEAIFTAPFQIDKALRQMTLVSLDDAAGLEAWYAQA